MKRKILSVISALSLIIGLSGLPVNKAEAADMEAVKDSSVFVQDRDSVGESVPEARGQYYQTGSSSIGLIGTGKIKVSGTTIAQKIVADIGLAVMVERRVGGSWESYTSWSVFAHDTYSLTSSKTLTVPRGYYYRVRCVHSANTDNSSSNTNALYVD